MVQTTSVQQWSLGYYTATGNQFLSPPDIEWGGLTHVIYAWALVNGDGSLDLASHQFSTYASSTVSNAHANGVKVLVSLGDPNNGADYSAAMSCCLSTFVANIMNIVNTYGFDGVDIELGNDVTSTKLGQLASALRAQLGSKLLTAPAVGNAQILWASVQSYFDRINIMTYDACYLGIGYSWFNDPLYSPSDNSAGSIDLNVGRFLGAGIPASKLGIGIGFYGWVYTGGGVTGPRQS